MRSRTRPRQSGNIQLDIRMRRMRRRSREQSHSQTPSPDIEAERLVILRRISELKAELAEQETHLQAIDVLLAAGSAANRGGRQRTESALGNADVEDAEFTDHPAPGRRRMG